MLVRGAFILIIALVLDLLQVVIGLGFTGVLAISTAALNFIPIFGTAANVTATAGGAVIGYIEDTSLSLGFGTLIVTLLLYNKMFYPGSVLMSYIFEMVPVVSLLPCWSALVGRSIYLTYKKQRKEEAETSYA